MRRAISMFCSRAAPPASTIGALALFVACAFTPTSLAHADGMRCGTKLVSDGDTLYDVLSRCGEPKFRLHRVELRTVRSWVSTPCTAAGTQCGRMVERTVEVQIDEWTYDFGPTQFIRYVTFEDGRLLRVESGAYGAE